MASSTGKRLGKKLAGIWRRNPVLISGMGLMPAVVATSSLKNAFAMCIVAAIVMIPTYILVSILKLKKPFYIRIAINALVAAVFAAPALLIVSRIFTDYVHGKTAVYLSAVVLDTIVIYRADQYARRNKVSDAAIDSIINFIGFALVLCIIAVLREFTSTGMIYGVKIIDSKYGISGISYPFFGFICVGMFSALLNFLNSYAEKRKQLNEVLDSMDAQENEKRKQKEIKRKLNLKKSKKKSIAAPKKEISEYSSDEKANDSDIKSDDSASEDTIHNQPDTKDQDNPDSDNTVLENTEKSEQSETVDNNIEPENDKNLEEQSNPEIQPEQNDEETEGK